jgi:Zn-dependent metalloprotease
MNIYRNSRLRSLSRVCAILFSCASFDAIAQGGSQVEASQLINFSAQDGLKAEVAVNTLSKRLEFNSNNDEFRSQFLERPGNGFQVQRFNQYYKGIRVEHGSFAIASENGLASYAFGRFYPTTAVAGISPKMDEAVALTKAIKAVPAEKYAWEAGEGEYPKGRVCLVEDFATGDGDNQLHLAYAFEIYAVKPETGYRVYVDANDGHILFADALIQNIGASGPSLYSGTVQFNAGLVAGIYYMYDSTRGGGIATYNAKNGGSTSASTMVSNTSNVFPLDPSVDAHWGAKIVYDYWKTVHNRNSWNGTGGILQSYVHWGNNYDNANWGNNVMHYGDGSGLISGGFPPLTALDVCGHEIGHGVCQSTAALVYSRESGAMNEGFSDIWGATIESFGNPHEVDAVAKDPWLIGEELTNTLRSMKDPKKYQQPNCYLGQYWINASTTCTPTGANDQCGVHYNSGVLNYWYYLICSGGKGRNDLGNDFAVDSIGMDKGAKIAYATELSLNSTANYNNCRTASLAAATTLYGACSPEYQAVENAWYAVGVGPMPSPCMVQLDFGTSRISSSENAGNDVCKPSRVISVPLQVNGGTLTGDSVVANIIVAGGTAVAGKDYLLLTPRLSFIPGGATSKNIDILVYDNGVSNTNRYVDISYSLNAGTTNAHRSPLMDTSRIYIFDDDYVPYAGNSNERAVPVFNGILNTTTPFAVTNKNVHVRYLYTADELYAAGIRPNVPISQAAFTVTTKVSTRAIRNFTMSIGHESARDFSQSIPVTVFTTVYSDSLSTLVGATPIPFSAPFVWNGVDNISVDMCFANDTSYTAGNDRVRGQTGTYVMAAMVTSNFNAGCNLAITLNNLSPARPIILFSQTALVETVQGSTRTWSMAAGDRDYFYSSSDHEIMAGVLNPSDSLGCVTVQVTQQGNGFKPASGGSQRSLKEFSIQPTVQSASVNYDAVFYVSNAELAGVDPNLIKIIQTTSTDDNNLIPSNTNVITPFDITSGVDFVAFSGSFMRFGRFFLSNGTPALGVNPEKSVNTELWTGQNPFTTAPVLHWTLSASENVTVRLYDVAGRVVYGSEEKLTAGTHALTLKSPADLPPGAYVLQVIRPGGVFTRKMMKQ